MPEASYILAAVIIAGVITLALRAVPFVILQPLRNSRFVSRMALWMPAGILLILAVTTFRDTAAPDIGPDHLWRGLIAAAVTVAVHLAGGRRTLLSVGAGTVVFVVLVNYL